MRRLSPLQNLQLQIFRSFQLQNSQSLQTRGFWSNCRSETSGPQRPACLRTIGAQARFSARALFVCITQARCVW